MGNPAPGKPTYEELEKQVADLAAKLEAALAEIERLKRGGHRQATPFSKGRRKPNPQRPGRKPGEGPFRFRAVRIFTAGVPLLQSMIALGQTTL